MKSCLFSISYAGLWGQHRLGLEEFIAHAAELGYEAVMIAGKRPHLSPLDTTPERLAAVRAALDRAGVECAVIAAYTDFAGGPAGEVPYVEFQVAYLEALARIAAALGAGIVRVFTAYQPEGAPAGLWDRVVTALAEAADRVAAQQVTLAIQNHHDLGVQTEALLELLADIDRPNVKLGFDAWSPALRGEDLYQAAFQAAPQTVITTNADYIRLPRFRYRPELVNYEPAGADLVRAVPFGDGYIDYVSFFNGLVDGGFDGVATYEACSPLRGGGGLANLDACSRRYLAWLAANIPGASARA